MRRKVRGYLSLTSVPSIPVTVVSLLFGYASATGTVLDKEILPLVSVGALGHMGFYGLNDIVDYEWDLEQNKENKPLVRGDITIYYGYGYCLALISVSVAVAIYLFPLYAFLAWVVACLLGALYDLRSKIDSYSAVYMAFWGVTIIYTGAFYSGGDIGGLTIVMSLLLGGHMLWMTIMGDLKDIGRGEKSIPERLDCKMIDENGYRYLWTSLRFNGLAILIVGIQIILILLIPIADGPHISDVMFVYVGIVGSLLVWVSFDNVLEQFQFDPDEMKRDIAKYEIISVITIIAVSLSFINIWSAVFLVVGSVVWGMAWQTVLYGHPLRFP